MVFILGAKLMRINVSCSKDYPIILERGIIQRLREYISDEHKIMIITDNHVDPLYADIVMNQFTRVYKTVVSNGEVSKSFETYEKCERELLKYNFSRNDIVIALGGGVVGDLSGFVAATYKRGIDFYNIPTTTLSMVDSSIGGKVAINVDDIKNCVGLQQKIERWRSVNRSIIFGLWETVLSQNRKTQRNYKKEQIQRIRSIRMDE